MEFKLIAVGIFRFAIIYLLLLGTNRLCGGAASLKCCLAAAVLGGVHSWGCLQPGFSFLGNVFWRCVFLILISGVAFGWSVQGLKNGAVFMLLMLALQGITPEAGVGRPLAALLGVGCLCVICILGFGGRPSAGACVPVELNYMGKCIRILALRDTGNFLKDPITGQSVLVVDAHVAQQLTGLTSQQLGSPLQVLTEKLLPGLRLIPYRALGKENGLLLAMRLPKVRIGSWQGSSLVAFAPGMLTNAGTYQALTGGV